MKTEKFNKTFDRWILPFFIVILSLLSIGSAFNLTLSIEELVRIDGTVKMIRIEEESTSKGRTVDNFYIYLSSPPYYVTGEKKFKIMDDVLFKPYRDIIQEKVKPGDKITIYKRTRKQAGLGLGTSNLIYQLEHKGEMLMPLKLMKKNFKELLSIKLFVLAILTAIVVVRARRKATDNRR